jgi:hypothetical protein
MAQVVVEMSGDEAKLFRSYQKIIDQAAKLDQKHKELKKSSQDAGQQAEQSFGGTAVAAIGKYAAGMLTLSAAAKSFGDMMAFNKMNTDAAIQSVEKLIATRSQLQQVSDTGPGVQANNDLANRLSMRGISRQAAQEIVFSAKSEGFTGSEDVVARIMAANELNSGSIRTLAGQIPGIFNGAISPIQGIAGGALAAKYSRLSTDELAAVLPKAAQGGQVAGSSPAETMALAGILATRGDRASEYMGTFAAQLATGADRKKFQGLGVVGMVSKLAGMGEAERQTILGTGKETNLAYQWIATDMAKIRNWTANIQNAMDNAEGFAGDVEGKAFDPTTAQGQIMLQRRASIVAGNRLEIGQENRRAAGGLSRQAARQRAAARWEEQGGSPGDAYWRDKAAGIAEMMGAPPTAIEVIGSPPSAASALDILLQIERNTREQQAASRSQAAANQQVE